MPRIVKAEIDMRIKAFNHFTFGVVCPASIVRVNRKTNTVTLAFAGRNETYQMNKPEWFIALDGEHQGEFITFS